MNSSGETADNLARRRAGHTYLPRAASAPVLLSPKTSLRPRIPSSYLEIFDKLDDRIPALCVRKITCILFRNYLTGRSREELNDAQVLGLIHNLVVH
jgi:hypothetical protein